MKNLAIITARSGSKGIVDKNIRLLNKKPLISYTISAAKECNLFDEIMVSTDSRKYAAISEEFGASVPFLRSEELSNDTASSWDVIKDVVLKYKELGMFFDTVALLQPTSPFRTSEDIIKSYNLMNEKNADSIVSVCEVEHPPIWTNILPENKSMFNFVHNEYKKYRRQDIQRYYQINGAIYIVKVKNLLEENFDIYSKNSYAFIMPRERSLDIDTEMDFTIAEAIFSKIK